MSQTSFQTPSGVFYAILELANMKEELYEPPNLERDCS